MKTAGLKSVRFTVSIASGDALTQKLKDTIIEWIEREENEIVPGLRSKQKAVEG
jgi:hypothetical protein